MNSPTYCLPHLDFPSVSHRDDDNPMLPSLSPILYEPNLVPPSQGVSPPQSTSNTQSAQLGSTNQEFMNPSLITGNNGDVQQTMADNPHALGDDDLSEAEDGEEEDDNDVIETQILGIEREITDEEKRLGFSMSSPVIYLLLDSIFCLDFRKPFGSFCIWGI